MEISKRQMKFAILEILAGTRSQHKMNIIGHADTGGIIDTRLEMTLSVEDRFMADQAFEELKTAGLIRPTYRDVVNPEQWVEITEKGKTALERRALDDLDIKLREISPHLVEIRDGAHSAAVSSNPDSSRQAAHSGRELIDQVLTLGARDTDVRKQSWFVPDKTSANGITRRHRLKYLMQLHRHAESDVDLATAEKAIDLVLEIDKGLTARAHLRTGLSEDIRDLLTAAEIALRKVLLG